MRLTTASRLAVFTLALAGLASLAQTAEAAVVYQDLFAYPNGNLVGQGGWYAHSGAGAKPIQVADSYGLPPTFGKVVLAQSAGSGEDINHPFTAQGILAKTYMGFVLNIPAGAVMGTANDYFIHFRPAAGDSNNFVSRVFTGPPTAGGDYNLGVGAGSLTTTPLATWATGLSFSTSYRVVVAYDPVSGGSQLWVNPVNESSTNVSTGAAATVVNKPVASVALRQASPTGATVSQVISQLSVASTFDEAVVKMDVPGLPSWGMPVVALLLLIGGAVFVMRRREAVA